MNSISYKDKPAEIFSISNEKEEENVARWPTTINFSVYEVKLFKASKRFNENWIL